MLLAKKEKTYSTQTAMLTVRRLTIAVVEIASAQHKNGELVQQLAFLLQGKPQVEEVTLISYANQKGEAGQKLKTLASENEAGWGIDIARKLRQIQPNGALLNLYWHSVRQGGALAFRRCLIPLILRLEGYPTIVLLQGAVLDSEEEPTLTFFERLLLRFILAAHLVVVTNVQSQEILLKKYGATNVILAPHSGDLPTPDALADLKNSIDWYVAHFYSLIERK